MVFIPEITTTISVNINTDGLDDSLKLMKSDSILSSCFGEVVSHIQDLRVTAESYQDPLAKKLSEKLQDNQSHRIAMKHTVTGLMKNSVDITHDGEGQYLVGNTAASPLGFPYPLVIEKGRRAVYPVEKPYLVFRTKNGTWVRTKSASAYAGDPFVQDSINMLEDDVDDYVNEYMEKLFG